MDIKSYQVLFTKEMPELQGLWDGAVWKNAGSLELDYFRTESSDHRPRTKCKLLYDSDNIYGIFRVEDNFIRCIHTGFQAEVYKDSCVEFFVQLPPEKGYFNFEFNCGGAMLASYITDPTRIAGGVREFIPLSSEDDSRIQRYHNLPDIIEPEIRGKIDWYLEFSIPIDVLRKYTGSNGDVGGQTWRANFYKCGNETSRPHWAAWAPLDQLNFHLPKNFGYLHLEKH
jgi:hypothetical protein